MAGDYTIKLLHILFSKYFPKKNNFCYSMQSCCSFCHDGIMWSNYSLFHTHFLHRGFLQLLETKEYQYWLKDPWETLIPVCVNETNTAKWFCTASSISDQYETCLKISGVSWMSLSRPGGLDKTGSVNLSVYRIGPDQIRKLPQIVWRGEFDPESAWSFCSLRSHVLCLYMGYML